MKYLIYFLTLSAFALLTYNATLLNFDALLEGQSGIAMICIFAAACVITLMLILLTSRAIADKKGI